MSEKIKIAISILIPYLFICATCWHITYWSTFNINPFEYLQVTDILISFSYPFLYTSIGVFILFITQTYLQDVILEKKNINGEDLIDRLQKVKFFKYPVIKWIIWFIKWFMICVFFLFVILLTYYTEIDARLIILPSLYMLIMMVLFLKSELYTVLYLEYRTNFIYYFALVILIIPTYSISHSRQLAVDIKENKEFNYTKQDSTYYKIIGKLGDYMILSTFDNKETEILDLNKVEKFKMYHYNQKINTLPRNNSLSRQKNR